MLASSGRHGGVRRLTKGSVHFCSDGKDSVSLRSDAQLNQHRALEAATNAVLREDLQAIEGYLEGAIAMRGAMLAQPLTGQASGSATARRLKSIYRAGLATGLT